MVNHVVADASLDAEAERLCAELSALGGDCLRPTKSFYRFAETARPRGERGSCGETSSPTPYTRRETWAET